ncbi:MAG: RDD family protein [Saprospiraceae bacterium]
MHYPSLTTRFKSILIDTTIVFIGGAYLASVIFEKMGEVPNWWRVAALIGLFFVYEPVSQTLGCSLGNYVSGIRVRKASDETQRINILQAAVRFVLKLGLGWVSFLTIHSNPKRQAIHDTVAGTVMITVKP